MTDSGDLLRIFDKHCPEADWSHIPTRMHGGILRYVIVGIQPGDFLYSVFADDFRNAVMRADDENGKLLRWYCLFLIDLPVECHGSQSKVNAWIKRGGLKGQEHV